MKISDSMCNGLQAKNTFPYKIKIINITLDTSVLISFKKVFFMGKKIKKIKNASTVGINKGLSVPLQNAMPEEKRMLCNHNDSKTVYLFT